MDGCQHGFGRRIMKSSGLKGFYYKVGQFTYDVLDGYGRKVIDGENYDEGMYQNDELVTPKDEVKSQDFIDLDKYFIKDSGVVPPKLVYNRPLTFEQDQAEEDERQMWKNIERMEKHPDFEKICPNIDVSKYIKSETASYNSIYHCDKLNN